HEHGGPAGSCVRSGAGLGERVRSRGRGQTRLGRHQSAVGCVRERRVSAGAREGPRSTVARGGDVSLATKRFDFATWFDSHGVTIIAILVVAIAVTVVTRIFVLRFRRKLEG